MNVVLVAVDNDMLPKAQRELQGDFKSQQFRAVGVDLSSSEPGAVMDPIVKATADILPQVRPPSSSFLGGGV